MVTDTIEKALFAAAVGIVDRGQRMAFLDQACPGNPVLRKQVETLLELQHASDDFFMMAVEDRTLAAAGACADLSGRPCAAPVPVVPQDRRCRSRLGDGTPDLDETSAGRDPNNAADLAFEFNTDGNYEGWDDTIGSMNTTAVAGGFLSGQSLSNAGKFENSGLGFNGNAIANLLVRVNASAGSGLVYRWAAAPDVRFLYTRTVPYSPGTFKTVVIPLRGQTEWDGQTITHMRLNPVNTLADFQIDWIRASDGDFDNDLLADSYEAANALDPLDPADGNSDNDGDGKTRGEEFIAGTSDFDGSDSLVLTIAAPTGGTEWNLAFDGKAGRGYSIYRSTTLTAADWTLVQDFGVLPADQSVQSTIPAVAGGREFFKLAVRLP